MRAEEAGVGDKTGVLVTGHRNRGTVAAAVPRIPTQSERLAVTERSRSSVEVQQKFCVCVCACVRARVCERVPLLRKPIRFTAYKLRAAPGDRPTLQHLRQ